MQSRMNQEVTIMFCSNCGQRLADDAKHCPNCGVLIRRDTENPEESARKEDNRYDYDQAAYSYSYGAPETPRPAAAPTYAAPPQPTKADGYALTGLILAIVSGVCCCIPFIGLPCAVLGIIFASKGLESENRRTMALIGLILAIIFTICNGVTLYAFIVNLGRVDTWAEIFENAGDYGFDDFYRFR